MRLSIIIPCYNMEVFLPECLNSLVDQGLDHQDYEIIIVNDGSKDKTLEIARSFESRYPEIRVIDKQNAGVGAARNTGLHAAAGSYIYFLDPDDYIAKDTLSEVLDIAIENELDILSFDSMPVKKNEYLREGKSAELPKSLTITDGITSIANRKFANEIWWYLVRKEFMTANNLQFIEGKWMEDAILTAQLFCAAERITHIEKDVHRYRILSTSAMRNKSPEHYRKVIFDNANAAHVFDDLMASLDSNHPFYGPCFKRLKTRQQSFVFFLLVRLMKSDLPVSKIPPMLKEFEEIGAYPLNKFLGPDYNGFGYSFMVFILNRKPLINPFMRFFRLFYRLVR